MESKNSKQVAFENEGDYLRSIMPDCTKKVFIKLLDSITQQAYDRGDNKNFKVFNLSALADMMLGLVDKKDRQDGHFLDAPLLLPLLPDATRKRLEAIQEITGFSWDDYIRKIQNERLTGKSKTNV